MVNAQKCNNSVPDMCGSFSGIAGEYVGVCKNHSLPQWGYNSRSVTAASSAGRVWFHLSPFRPRSKQVEENRPFSPSPLPSSPFLRNLFSGSEIPVRALWGGRNMELGKHQGSLTAGITTPIYHGDNSLFSRRQVIKTLWRNGSYDTYFLSQAQTLIVFTVSVFTTSPQRTRIRCLECFPANVYRLSHIWCLACGHFQRRNNKWRKAREKGFDHR